MLESHTTTTTSTTEHYVLQVRRGHLLSLFLIFFFIWMDLVICWPCPERVYVLFEPGVSMIFCIRNEKALIAAMVNRRSLSMRRVANNSETDPAAFQCFLKDFVCCTCPSSFVLILILPAINQCQHDFLHLSFFFPFSSSGNRNFPIYYTTDCFPKAWEVLVGDRTWRTSSAGQY